MSCAASLACVLLASSGCTTFLPGDDRADGGGGPADATRIDARTERDASDPVDGSVRDATATDDDASPIDDAGLDDDAGAPMDAGTREDASPMDAAPLDAGPIDAGPPDADPIDMALPDAFDPCSSISCGVGFLCSDGGCVDDGSCSGVVCPTGQECFPGLGCLAVAHDGDGDGVTVGEGDCDDTDRFVFPDAPERCNGIDDDCSGERDEGNPGGGGGCTTTMPGICGPGTQQCRDGRLQCVPNRTPIAETCNAIDDDCSGTADDHLPGIEVVNTTFAALSAQVAACTGRSSWIMDCQAAAHRLCLARSGCNVGGFGPIPGPSAGSAIVGCVTSGETIETTFAVLATHSPMCMRDLDSGSLYCLNASHRFCAAMTEPAGRAGFGPVEQVRTVAEALCIDGSVAVSVAVSALTALDSGCSGGGDHSFACNTAVHEHCQSLGYASGWGPVELAGGVAHVRCISP